ncbi:hypothetical protein [Actinotalea sp. K2]|uniref:hypothetical protein n=1 Tax=Actinotalea sp. K2 TaxID=2939438 RepID=UPI002016D27A|nr:hypothetical protein [Actinotalea sp. K2]MCL3862532.1 hypothetical protein [Actinotalea sp. K2]
MTARSGACDQTRTLVLHLRKWKVPDVLASMENAQDALRDIDRAAAAPFVNDPVTAWWYPPTMAGFFTAMAAGPLLISQGRGAAGFGLQAVALITLVMVYAAHRAKSGTSPRMRSAPDEFKHAYRWLCLTYAGSLAVSVVVWVLLGWQVGLSAVFVTMLAATWSYERVVYPRAVHRVRNRLA